MILKVLNRLKPKNEEQKNIYHCCIQKTGSQWLKKIFSDPLVYELTGMKAFNPQRNFLGGDPIRDVIENPFPPGTIVTPFYVDYEDFKKIPKPPDWKAFFVMRDPRDFLISWYQSVRYSHPLNPYIKEQRKILKKMSDREAVTYLISTIFDKHNVQYNAMKNWYSEGKKDEFVLLLRYEDLISPAGPDFFAELFDFFQVDIKKEQLDKLLGKYSFRKLSGGREPGEENRKKHYRKGISGDWKNYFSPEHKDAFREAAGEILADLEYETNSHW